MTPVARATAVTKMVGHIADLTQTQLAKMFRLSSAPRRASTLSSAVSPCSLCLTRRPLSFSMIGASSAVGRRTPGPEFRSRRRFQSTALRWLYGGGSCG